MKAIHGGKAKNDKIDAHKIAVLLRGGMLPQAYVYPAEMRATRDLLRRRCHLVRKRAALLAHIHNTNSQDNLPAIEKRLTYKANREGVVDHFPDPSVRKTIEVDVSLIDHYDKLLGEVELYITRTAKTHDVQTFVRLQSVPGIGQILALVILYEIQDIARFPRVQDFVSYCRLVKCAKESNGKRLGTAGKKIGNVQLRWALAEAAVLFLRQSQPGKAYFAKLERKHGKAKALTVLAHKLGRAVLGIGRGDSALAHLGLAPVPVKLFRTYVERVQGYLRGEELPFDIQTDSKGEVASADVLSMASAPTGSKLRWAQYAHMPKVPVDGAVTGPKPIAAAQTEDTPNRYATWPDTLGLESAYDYDPVWAKCVELKVVPTFQSASQGVGTRVSYSNFVYNHIGHFAAAGEAV